MSSKDSITTVDLLVHPFYGFNDDSAYGGFVNRGHYLFLNSMLTTEEISGRDYTELLFRMYKERLDEIAENSETHFGLLTIRGNQVVPNLLPQEIRLMGYAQHQLGDRAFLSYDNDGAMFGFFHDALKNKGPIKFNVYGEISGICVKTAAESYENFLRKSGIPTESQIIEELCGDLPKGKLEAWQRLRE